MKVHKRIKQVMDERGMAQGDLAKAMMWSPMTASRTLSGARKLKDDELIKVAIALGVAPDALTEPCEDAAVYEPVISRMKSSNLPVKEAARLMGKDAQYVRIAIQRGMLPFGIAIKGTGDRYSYYISRKQFQEYTGINVTQEDATDA